MKNTVKILSLVLVLVLMLPLSLLVGCDSSEESKAKNADANSESENSTAPETVYCDPAIARQIVKGMTYEQSVEMLGSEAITDGGAYIWHLADGSFFKVFIVGNNEIDHTAIYTIENTGAKCPEGVEEIASISLNAYGWMNLRFDLEEHAAEIAKIVEYMKKANGAPTISTEGFSGESYTIDIVKTNGEIFTFHLWGENMFYTNEYVTSDEYGAFVYQDVSAFYNYIKQTFPDECFETEN